MKVLSTSQRALIAALACRNGISVEHSLDAASRGESNLRLPQRRSQPKPHDLYIVKCASDPPMYKVGVSRNIKVRLGELQVGNPWPLALVLVVPGGGFKLERRLHHKFRSTRTFGEWFRESKSITDFILNGGIAT